MPSTDIADLLANPPPAGEIVEVDAYYGAEYGMTYPGLGRDASMAGCPSELISPLTDLPYPITLAVLSTARPNEMPSGAAWLLAAAAPGEEKPLPFHGRLRGHLGEPRFQACRHAERIFVIDEVVAVYAADVDDARTGAGLRDATVAWPRIARPAQGFSVAHPPGWQVDERDPEVLVLSDPNVPAYPVTVHVLPSARAVAGNVYVQHQAERLDTPPLSARFTDECAAGNDERCIAARFDGGERTYELMLRYPIGFEASQALLVAYTGIVDRFRIDGTPTKTATPPVQTALGGGPFWTREQAEDMAMGMIPSGPWRVDDARLVPEAEARDLDLCDIDGTISFRDDPSVHPDGVWIVRLDGLFDGRAAVYNTYLDAVSGNHLCTADEATRAGR